MGTKVVSEGSRTTVLTSREREVLCLAPLLDRQIGARLGISPATVSRHFSNMREKMLEPGDPRLNRCTKLILLILALQRGWIAIDEVITE